MSLHERSTAKSSGQATREALKALVQPLTRLFKPRPRPGRYLLHKGFVHGAFTVDANDHVTSMWLRCEHCRTIEYVDVTTLEAISVHQDAFYAAHTHGFGVPA